MKKISILLLVCMLVVALGACGANQQNVEQPVPETVDSKGDADTGDTETQPENAEAEPEAEPEEIELTEGEVIALCVPLDEFSVCGVKITDSTLESFQGIEGYSVTSYDNAPDHNYFVNISNGQILAIITNTFVIYGSITGETSPSEYDFAIKKGDSLEKISALFELEDGDYDSKYGTVNLVKNEENKNAGDLGTYKLLRVHYVDAGVYFDIFHDGNVIYDVSPKHRL